MDKTVICDVDGVVSDTIAGLVTFIGRQLGCFYPYDDLQSYQLETSLGLSPEEFQRYFLRYEEETCGLLDVPTVRGAIDAIADLRQSGCKVLFATSRPDCLRDSTVEWLGRRFRVLPEEVFFASSVEPVTRAAGKGRKSKIEIAHDHQATALIDDSPGELLAAMKYITPVPIAFTQPWNERDDRLKGVSRGDWPSIVRLLSR